MRRCRSLRLTRGRSCARDLATRRIAPLHTVGPAGCGSTVLARGWQLHGQGGPPPLSLWTPCGGTGRLIASSGEPPDHRTADVPALAPVSGRRETSKRSRGGAHWRHDPPRADLLSLGLGGKPGMRPLAPAKPNGCRNRLCPVRRAEFLKYAPEMKCGGNFFNADLPSDLFVGFAFKEQ